MSRTPEDQVWMNVAKAVSERSRCVKQVGAVIVGSDGRVVATGYNGPPAGYIPAIGFNSSANFCPRDGDSGHKDPGYEDCVCVHAETNALLYSDRASREGGTIYVTSVPCFGCAKSLAASGLSRVVYPRADRVARAHRDPLKAIRFLENCELLTDGLYQ